MIHHEIKITLFKFRNRLSLVQN